ncbi:hypothetical protein STEG23_020592, partial [Scotinomys teguina]
RQSLLIAVLDHILAVRCKTGLKLLSVPLPQHPEFCDDRYGENGRGEEKRGEECHYLIQITTRIRCYYRKHIFTIVLLGYLSILFKKIQI